MKLLSPKISKYQRARPWVREIRQGRVKLNNRTSFIDDLIDETVCLDPGGGGESPDLLDSVTQAKNYLDKKIRSTRTRFSLKKISGNDEKRREDVLKVLISQIMDKELILIKNSLRKSNTSLNY